MLSQWRAGKGGRQKPKRGKAVASQLNAIYITMTSSQKASKGYGRLTLGDKRGKAATSRGGRHTYFTIMVKGWNFNRKLSPLCEIISTSTLENLKLSANNETLKLFIITDWKKCLETVKENICLPRRAQLLKQTHFTVYKLLFSAPAFNAKSMGRVKNTFFKGAEGGRHCRSGGGTP